MPDREKVIKGLECCASMNGGACRECPYSSDCIADEVLYQTGTAHLAADALALLKEQEPVEAVDDPDDPLLAFCGECGHTLGFRELFKYCPYCGKAVKWE